MNRSISGMKIVLGAALSAVLSASVAAHAAGSAPGEDAVSVQSRHSPRVCCANRPLPRSRNTLPRDAPASTAPRSNTIRSRIPSLRCNTP